MIATLVPLLGWLADTALLSSTPSFDLWYADANTKVFPTDQAPPGPSVSMVPLSGARGEKRPSAYRRPEPQSAEPRKPAAGAPRLISTNRVPRSARCHVSITRQF